MNLQEAVAALRADAKSLASVHILAEPECDEACRQLIDDFLAVTTADENFNDFVNECTRRVFDEVIRSGMSGIRQVLFSYFSSAVANAFARGARQR